MDEPSSSSRNNNRSNLPEDSTRSSARGRPRNDGRPGGLPSTQVLPPPPPEEDPNSNRKRSRTAPNPHANHAKMPRKETDVVDRIWHDIDEEQREKQAKKKAAAEEARRTEPPVTSVNTCLELTVANLKNFKNEDSTVNDFISREGMVDRLLGYKMLLGKMENCSTLGYEKMNDKEISELSSEWFKKFHPEAEMVKEEPQRRGPRTPSSPPPADDIDRKPRRGPHTPPGSPGPSNQPPQVPANRREMVEQLARTFGQSTHEVEEALGDQLDKALEDCSKKLKNEMMETFKATIKKMMEKKGKISSDLSDQMELVSDTSLSVDMKIVKREETEMQQYHMVVPPPPIPPNMQPNYAYYPPGPPVYQYHQPPAQPVYQQNIMCYGPPPVQHYAQAPPQMHYQMQPTQPYQHQPISTMVLPPVNVPPPPMGVRIDTPMPQQIPPVVQALPPTAMPPPPIPPQGPPPPLPPLMAPQQSAPPQFTGDCWRPNPPPPQPLVPSDSWQQQTPVTPMAPPVSAVPLVAGVQTTLFSALGLHKPPPPPPPPSGSSAPPFASLSAPPPPPPPPIVGPSSSSLNFPPPPPPPSQSAVVLSSPTSNGYRHHGSSGRVPPFSNPYNNF